MLDPLARFIDRRRRAVLVLTVVVVAVAGMFGGPVVGLLSSDDDFEDPASEAVAAREAIVDATGRSAAPDAIALVRLGAPIESPQAQAKLRRVVEAMRDRDVAQVLAVRGGKPRAMLSRDRRSTYVVATFKADTDDEAVVARLERRLAREQGVALGGGKVAFVQVGDQVEQDLARAEMLGLPILFLLSLLVFRSVVAALLPLAVGI